MGRSEEIWGKDCLEFKPERWISEKGGIIHVPSYKYITFNAGPRTCLGKEMSFVEMKMVASAILWNYHVQVVEGHPVYPSLSIGLFMKHGLEVRITKRQRETVEGRKSILGKIESLYRLYNEHKVMENGGGQAWEMKVKMRCSVTMGCFLTRH
ncbi:hypothetical protein L6164_017069 [Bauhinia variegata]|uniref:Uncharacterized protein n=1 Tax=Bauhinia variegata TaxID=167791 RepID=A0ACB9NBR5_BAUVA|nr:hypothetical protein L6164_017069 [Bauhinia variegata]